MLGKLIILIASIHALSNGLGRTPQMGWNTWNHFGCTINADVIISAAQSIVQLGLKDLGYTYINIDDCWSLKARDQQGNILVDTTKFPNGIKGLADQIHSMGMKLGIYSDAGEKTCGGQPGSLNYEELDANAYASWGIDYLKYDNCYNRGVPAQLRYGKMMAALNKTGRHIFYSLCNWGDENVWKWGEFTANSWRTTIDIKDFFSSMKLNYYYNSLHPEVAGPGGFNDPDMLEIGNGGMSLKEYKTHFSLWCIAKAPLILGSDLSKLSKEELSIISNKELIEINQDHLGRQALCMNGCSYPEFFIVSTIAQVWMSPLVDGSFGIVVVNWNKLVPVKGSIEMKGKYKIRDLWEHKEIGEFEDKYSTEFITGHDCAAYRITPISSK